MEELDALQLLQNTLVGRRVTAASSSELTLDDGTTLTLYESESDCCASATGDWEIIDPGNLDAAITAVKLDSEYHEGDYESHSTGTITIMHNQNAIALGDLYANSGNGDYYYSVLSVRVALPAGTEIATPVLSSR